MDSKEKKSGFKWLMRVFAAGIACGAGILLGISLSRTEIATYFANRALAAEGFFDSRVRISRLDPTRCVLDQIRLQTDSLSLEIAKTEIRYEIETLWREQSIQSIQISGLKLSYRAAESSHEPASFDLQEWNERLKSSLPLPLDSLAIENATIEWFSDLGRLAGEVALTVSQNESSEIRLELNAHSETESIDLEAVLSESIAFSSTVSTDDLQKTLTRYGIDWKALLQFPEEATLSTSSATLQARGGFSGAKLLGVDISTSLGPIRYADPEGKAAARGIQAELTLDAEGQLRDIKAILDLEYADYATVETGPSLIEIQVPNLQKLSLKLPETTWTAASGESGRLAGSLTTHLNSDFSVSRFELRGSAKELVSDAFELQPFDFSIEGNLDSLQLATSPLAVRQIPWIRFEQCEIAVTELASQNPLVTLSGALTAASSDAIDAPFSGSWELAGKLRPMSRPQTVELSLHPATAQSLLPIPGASFEGKATLDLKLRHWSEEAQVAWDLNFKADALKGSLDDWSLDGGAFDASLSTGPLLLSELQGHLEKPRLLLEKIAHSSQFAISLQGNQATGPGQSAAQWFSGTLQSKDAAETSTSPIQATFELGIGIARFPPEEIQQLALATQIEGDTQQLRLDTRAELLFEGEPVSIATTQSLDFSADRLNASAEYAIKGIKLINSDILSRHEPTLSGTTVSARIGIGGTARIDEGGWDATATIQLADGAFAYPPEDIAIDAIQATIAFDSIAERRSAPSQTLTAGQLTLGDLQATDLAIQFSLDGREQLAIEKAQLATFNGTLALDPFELSLEDPVADLVLRFDDISIAPAIAMLDFFDGHVNGRLDGTLPIHLVDGRPTLGEGYLELSPDSDATFSYNAKGFFTNEGDPNAPPKTMSDKLLERLGLEPNALLEDALGKLDIHDLRIDLFNKDLPDTPMRIQLIGIADTRKTQIPLNITTNINGTIAELFDFLKRLDSLGLVVDQ